MASRAKETLSGGSLKYQLPYTYIYVYTYIYIHIYIYIYMYYITLYYCSNIVDKLVFMNSQF